MKTTVTRPAQVIPVRVVRTPLLLRGAWKTSLVTLGCAVAYLLGAHFRTEQAAWTDITDPWAWKTLYVAVAATVATALLHLAWRSAVRRS